MAKEDVKSFKMDSDLKSLVNDRIEKSGMEGAEWLESLMALEVIHRISKDDPTVQHDLKDLEKFMNRIYHIMIRVYQRGADAVDEIKETSIEAASLVAAELEGLRIELSSVQKSLKQKEEELSTSYSTNIELRQKMEQFEKTAKTIEELNRLTKEKVDELQKRNDSLLDAEKAAAEMKDQLAELKQYYAQEMATQKEAETKLIQQLTDLQKDSDRRQKEVDETIAKILKEHEREKEILKKEMEMKAREELLNVKSKWQDKVNEISEMHSGKMAELVDKLQGSQKGNI
ncbi:histone-lysine N-methyltransferase, H3 lysine-79 [Paenibacillus sp. FSL L8-0709]|uniref:histone-lysine N-methyltransferase, H3 lysine-79 n=1 Tax=Paenibacillus sp. FSL L8-0709 TaxID=2975312 RepID=UPI0030F77B83